MPTKLQKLELLKELRNPSLAILNRIQMIKGDKGDKGDRGEKGERGESLKGDKGDRGANSTVMGPAGKDGKDGKDAKVDINQIAELAAAKVKPHKPQKIVIPTLEEIVKEAVIEFEKNKKKISIRDIHDLNELIEYLKAGGFRGGGSSASSGGSFTLLNTASTVDGANQSFIFNTATAQPTLVNVDGAQLTALDNNGGTQWSWNAGTKTVTLTTPPPINSIFAIQ